MYNYCESAGSVQRVQSTKGHFLEHISESGKAEVYKLCKKITFFVQKGIIYPYVNFNDAKKAFY